LRSAAAERLKTPKRRAEPLAVARGLKRPAPASPKKMARRAAREETNDELYDGWIVRSGYAPNYVAL